MTTENPDAGSPTGERSVMYRYTDDAGVLHVVDVLDVIPQEYREAAESYVLEGGKKAVDTLKATVRARDLPGVARFVGELDSPSVVVGFATGLLATLVLGVFKTTGKLLIKVAFLLVVAGLLFGAYFGWVRRNAGLSEGAVSGPGPILDDARRAAEQLRERIQRDQKRLEELEEQW